MQSPIILQGIGEMAGVFARGLLRAGYPLVPLTRDMDPATMAQAYPQPALVLLAVGEKDLPAALDGVPAAWRDRLALLQNELLPRDWQARELSPTVISVWFEKKPGQDYKVIVPSPIHGPHAGILADGLGAMGIPHEILGDEKTLWFELVRKNVYILTSNLAGLVVGGTVESLWAEHESLARDIALDVLAIQEKLVGQPLDAEALIQAMLVAFRGDPDHKCMGRSAPARLQRALAQAEAFGLAVPALRKIQP